MTMLIGLSVNTSGATEFYHESERYRKEPVRIISQPEA
jgi:hypothetical protein